MFSLRITIRLLQNVKKQKDRRHGASGPQIDINIKSNKYTEATSVSLLVA